MDEAPALTMMRIHGFRLQRAKRPRPCVLLTLTDGEGHEGGGDAAPLAPFSPEDADACALAIEGARELDAIDERLPAAHTISLVLKRIAPRLDAAPSARLAIETAILDLLAQRRGTAVAAILGGGMYDTVALNALLIAPPLDTLADRAEALAREGFTAIKIKLRATDEAGFERELSALREVRARLPLPFELRLDPNGVWSLDEARRRLDQLAPIAPRYVEQPVSARDLPRLGECSAPWAADESLVIPDLVPSLLTSRGCAAFVLKPAVLGGLIRARDIAIRAQDRGIDVVVTHLFDGPFAMAAACELALSLPRAPLACGLAPHDDLARFGENLGGVAIPQLATPGVARSNDAPGLGVRSTWVCEGRG